MGAGFSKQELNYLVELGIDLVNNGKISAFNYFKEKYDDFNVSFVVNYFHDQPEHMESLCKIIEEEIKKKLEMPPSEKITSSIVPRYTFYIFNPKYLEKEEIFDEYSNAVFYDGEGNEIKIQDIPKRKGPFKVRNKEFTINFKVNTIKDVVALADIFDEHAYRFMTDEQGDFVLKKGLLVPNPDKTIPRKWIEPVIIIGDNKDKDLETNLMKYRSVFKVALIKGEEEISTLVGNEYRYRKLMNNLRTRCPELPVYLRKERPYEVCSKALLVVPRLVNKIFKNLLVGKPNFPESSV